MESSICDAFAEFFELLTDSEYVFPDEQFKDILKKQLGNLEHQKLSDSKVLPPHANKAIRFMSFERGCGEINISYYT